MTASERERLSAEDRRRQIVEAALPIFAQKGFKGTTTKELALAAGVSEALIYKHFPSKEQLFKALDVLCKDEVNEIGEHFAKIEPSTQMLVTGIYFLVRLNLWGMPGQEAEGEMLKRMITNSLLDDGHFARLFIESRFEPHIPTIEAGIRAAGKSGDLEAGVATARCRTWLAHHTLLGAYLFTLPGEMPAAHGVDRAEYLHETVRYTLRGLGLKESAIEKYFDPAALSNWMEETAKKTQKPAGRS